MARSLMVPDSLEGGRELEKEGVSCEVIDPRTIRPLDIRHHCRPPSRKRIARSSPKSRIRSASVGAEISAEIMERALIISMLRSSASQARTSPCLTRRISSNWRFRTSRRSSLPLRKFRISSW